MTALATPIEASTRWHLRAFRTGVALLGVVGLAHLLVKHLFNGPLPAGEQAVADLSAQTPTPMFEGWRAITVLDLYTGYSVGMGLLGTTFAVLAIVVARQAPQLIHAGSLFVATCFVTCAGTFAVSALYFPEPVVVFAGLSAACVGAVLFAGPSRAQA